MLSGCFRIHVEAVRVIVHVHMGFSSHGQLVSLGVYVLNMSIVAWCTPPTTTQPTSMTTTTTPKTTNSKMLSTNAGTDCNMFQLMAVLTTQ